MDVERGRGPGSCQWTLRRGGGPGSCQWTLRGGGGPGSYQWTLREEGGGGRGSGELPVDIKETRSKIVIFYLA